MMPSEVINGKLMHMATEQIPGKGGSLEQGHSCMQLFSNLVEERMRVTLQYMDYTQVQWSSTGRSTYSMSCRVLPF